MSEKSSAEVIIGGKVYTLSGYEGEEYLQKVSTIKSMSLIPWKTIGDFRRI